MDYAQLRADTAAVCGRLADSLRSAPDAQQRATGLDWTVADIGAHLVTVARRNIDVAGGSSLHWDLGELTHRAMAEFNEREIAALGVRDLAALAEMLAAESEVLLDAYGTDGARAVRWPHYETRAKDAVGVWLGELLVHGLDLARTLGRDWAVRDDQAAAIFDGLVPALGVFANREAARRAAGVYHVHLRGQADYTFEVLEDGTVAATMGRPGRADLHVSANPVSYLLVGYGRASPWGAFARGAVVAWGRRPLLGLRFATLFEQP